MAISLRLSDRDTALIKNYAALHNISVSQLVRDTIIERIEDEIDLQCIAEYEASPKGKTISHSELKKSLGL